MVTFNQLKNFTDFKDRALILHASSEFSYKSANPENIGITKSIPFGKKLNGQLTLYTKCGSLMHSNLVVTPEGLPLGLSAVKFWTRKQFKGAKALKNYISSTRISIEKKGDALKFNLNLNIRKFRCYPQ